MYHILCHHSSIGPHFVASTFWLLWIVLLGISVYSCLSDSVLSVLLGVCRPRMELLDHMVVLFLIFWKIGILVFTTLAPFCITISSTQGLQLLYIPSNTFFHFPFLFLLFLKNNSVLMDVLHCGFDSHFSKWLVILNISFLTPVGYFYVFGDRVSKIWILCRYLNCFFVVVVESEFFKKCILDINALSAIWFANIFSHLVGLTFYSVDSIPWYAKVLNFDVVHLFSFDACVFGVICKKPLLNLLSWSFPTF